MVPIPEQDASWFQGHSGYIDLNFPYSPWASQKLHGVGCVTVRVFRQIGWVGLGQTLPVSKMPYKGTQDYFLRNVSYCCSADLIQKCVYLLCPNPHSSFSCLAAFSSISSSYQNDSTLSNLFWADSLCLIEIFIFYYLHLSFIFFLFLVPTDVLFPREYIHLFIYSLFFQILFISGW